MKNLLTVNLADELIKENDKVQQEQQKLINVAKTQLKMASCEDEVSYSGGFAPYLIDGLRGFGDTNMDGIVTAEEAFYYAEPRPDHQDPTMASQRAREMVVDPDIMGVIGHFDDRTTTAALSAYGDAGLALIVPTGTALAFTKFILNNIFDLPRSLFILFSILSQSPSNSKFLYAPTDLI